MSIQAPRGRHAAFVFIAITVWLDYSAQSITFPLLPRLARLLLNGDAARAARWVGWLEVGWAIPQFLGAPLFGMISDRFGRRPVIVLSLFGVAGELVLNALAPDVGWLLAGRILCGLTCGAIAPAMAYVADITAPEDRTRAFGRLNAAIWAGVILGPAIGGLLATAGLRTPFWAAAALAAANGVYGLFVLPESLPKESRAPIRWAKANPWGAVDLIFSRPGLLILGAALLMVWLAFQATSNMLVLYTSFRYGWGALTFGVFCAVMGSAAIVTQALLAGRVARRIGDRNTVLGGLIAQVIGLTVMGLTPSAMVFSAINLLTILGGVAQPALQSMMSATVGADEQGRLQGAVGSISSLTSIVAPIVFTQLFAWTIAPGHPPAWSGITMLAGAGLSLVAASLVLGSRSRPQPDL